MSHEFDLAFHTRPAVVVHCAKIFLDRACLVVHVAVSVHLLRSFGFIPLAHRTSAKPKSCQDSFRPIKSSLPSQCSLVIIKHTPELEMRIWLDQELAMSWQSRFPMPPRCVSQVGPFFRSGVQSHQSPFAREESRCSLLQVQHSDGAQMKNWLKVLTMPRNTEMGDENTFLLFPSF